MANTAEGGYRFLRMRNGATVPVTEVMPVANNYATALFRGDVLKRVNDGTVAAMAATDAAVYGIMDGVVQYNSGGQLRSGNYLPANTTFSPTTVGSPNESLVRVILAKDAIFEVDCSTAAASVAAAQSFVGNNADIVAGAGSTTTGRSGHTLDTSGPGTGAAEMRILAISKRIDNDVTAVNWKAEVTVNETLEPTIGSVTGV